MSLRRDWWTFIRLVGKAWWSLVGVMAAVATLLWLLRPDFPFSVLPGFFWLLSCLLVVVAAFRVWRSVYHQVQELQSQDARLVFDPVRGGRVIEVSIPAWTIGPELIAPEIGLSLRFSLVNHGTKAATLDDLVITLPDSQGVSSIVFGRASMFRHRDEGRPPLVRPGESFQPESPVRVECHLMANVTEKSPEEFAREIGKLRGFSVSIAWAYHGVGESVRDEVAVAVQVGPLKEAVFSHWEHKNRGDLVKLAQQASRQTIEG